LGTCHHHFLDQSPHAVAWHDLTVPSLSMALSSVHHRVTLAPHTLLSMLDTTLDKIMHHTPQTSHAQTRPERAHARQSTHGERRRRARPRRRATRSVDPCPFSLRQPLHDVTVHRPDIAIGPRERRRRRPLRRRPPRVLAALVTLSSSPVHRFHRNRAQHDRIDIANTHASSPVHLRPCSLVIIDEHTAASRPPLAAIKGAPRSSN
jgi:hypothetical protein